MILRVNTFPTATYNICNAAVSTGENMKFTRKRLELLTRRSNIQQCRETDETKQMTELILLDDQSISVVEFVGFRCLIETLEPLNNRKPRL